MASEAANLDSDGRRYGRLPFDATVQFRTGNRRAAVQVRDISPLGAKISGVFLVQQGDRFWLKLPKIEALEAQVAWFTDFEFGCEFIRPLSPLVFESIVGPN